MLELILLAAYSKRTEKLQILQRASVKFDALKFFLNIIWELKLIETKPYSTLGSPLNDVGKMLGKWMASLQ